MIGSVRLSINVQERRYDNYEFSYFFTNVFLDTAKFRKYKKIARGPTEIEKLFEKSVTKPAPR